MKENSCFVLIPKEILRDHNLSWAARGLFAYMLTIEKGIDERICASETSPYIAELIEAGYLKKPKGKYRQQTKLVCHTPILQTKSV